MNKKEYTQPAMAVFTVQVESIFLTGSRLQSTTEGGTTSVEFGSVSESGDGFSVKWNSNPIQWDEW